MPSPNTIHSSAPCWIRITITVDEADSDSLASFLGEQTGGVEQISEGSRERLICYIMNDSNAPGTLERISAHLETLALLASKPDSFRLHTETIPDEDWNRLWKERFTPFSISPHLVIKPSWEDYQAKGQEKIIEIDPGMAFGTGHHESTRLALEYLDALYHAVSPCPCEVLDVGTGTGILAMAAALFGAKKVLAIDNDPEALNVARKNLERNRLTDLVTADGMSLEAIDRRFDLVIANIIHNTLIDLAPALCERVAPGGRIILAGILAGPQTDTIHRTYKALGLDPLETKEAGEWSALLFSRKA